MRDETRIVVIVVAGFGLLYYCYYLVSENKSSLFSYWFKLTFVFIFVFVVVVVVAVSSITNTYIFFFGTDLFNYCTYLSK